MPRIPDEISDCLFYIYPTNEYVKKEAKVVGTVFIVVVSTSQQKKNILLILNRQFTIPRE